MGSKTRIAHTDPIFHKLNILKIKDVLNQRMAKLCYRYVSGILPHGLNDILQKKKTTSKRLRHRKQLVKPTPLTNWESKIMKHQAPRS